jgi:RNA polymerase sigma-70 factor (ECF subfamily)
MRAWLFRIARNAHIDRLRRKAHEPVLSEMEDIPSPHPISGEGSGWEIHRWKGAGIDREDVFYDLFGDEVNRFLSELPPEFRLALVLCDVEELSYQEIGQVMGCPVGTVRSRISRARSLLRDKLYHYAKSLGYVKEKAV